MTATTLSPAWRASLEEAWSAYLEGSLPIGACVTDASGRVLSVGRNRLGEPRRVDGVIGGHDLGHAEVNALLSLHQVLRPDCYGWTVHTTVEPCPQCVGALVMSGVRGLHYAAADAWAGCADLLTTHPYMIRKGMRVGRAPDEVIRASLLLHTCAMLEGGRGGVVDAQARHSPAEMALARQLHAAGTLRRLRHQRAGLDTVLAALA